jgi:amino acid permease
MKVAKYVFAFVCFGVGAAFIFGATHTVDNTFASFETAALGGVGALFLLGTFLLLRR